MRIPLNRDWIWPSILLSCLWPALLFAGEPVIPASRIAASVKALDGIVQGVMQRTGVPGLAIALVHRDRVLYSKGFGVRRIGAPEPVDSHTVFQLASLSKPVGATVVAGVVGTGLVRWDSPVVNWLPDFELADAYVTRHVTIGDLYSHRSGLPDHAGDLLEDLGYSRGEILQRLRHVPLAPFRLQHLYTNFGLTAAAEAVAKAAGTSWESLSERILYRPLGMQETSSRHADYLKAPNRAVLHVRVGKAWVARHDRQPDAQSPAGGVSSSAADMARWLRLQLANGTYAGQRIIDEQALQESRYPRTLSKPPGPDGRASFYGYGMGVGYDATGRVRLSHSGAFLLGAATMVVLLPTEHLGLVVLTNGMPVGAPEAVALSVLDLVETGRVQRDWLETVGPLFAGFYENPSRLAGRAAPHDPAPARANAAYVGVYDNRYYGPARVTERNGGLALELGPARRIFPLRHWSGDTFAYEPDGENAVGVSAVDFTVAGSQVHSLVIEHLDANLLGTFLRR